MKVKLTAGAELDLLTKDELDQVMRKVRKDLIPYIPSPRRITAADNAASTGTALVDLGSPKPGFYWRVRRYSVCGQDPTVDFTFTQMVVFLGGGSPDATLQPDPFTFVERVESPDLPSVSTYGPGELTVPAERHLYFYATGMTSGALLAVNAEVEEWPRNQFERAVGDGEPAPDDSIVKRL